MGKTINMGDFDPLLGNLEEYVNKQGCTLGKEAEILQELLHCIAEYIDNDTDAKACMRWYFRGLPLKHAIRKVLVDAEINRNCKKYR